MRDNPRLEERKVDESTEAVSLDHRVVFVFGGLVFVVKKTAKTSRTARGKNGKGQ